MVYQSSFVYSALIALLSVSLAAVQNPAIAAEPVKHQLTNERPNFYDQSRARKQQDKPSLPPGEWPAAIAPKLDSPRQSPRNVNSNAIDSGYAFEGQADKRAKAGEIRQICKNSGSEKPECRSYEYQVAPPGKVPYEAPSWQLVKEKPNSTAANP